MKLKTLLTCVALALFALQFSGCGQPPQPVDVPKAGSPHGGMAPSQEEARVAGTIVFEGAGFTDAQNSLFVSVRPKGGRAPWLSRKYPLSTTPLVDAGDGTKTLAFELRSRDPSGQTANLNGLHSAPVECEVYVCYKKGLTADDDTLSDALARFESGKSDYVLTLHLP
jgi:hypothetical protein